MSRRWQSDGEVGGDVWVTCPVIQDDEVTCATVCAVGWLGGLMVRALDS